MPSGWSGRRRRALVFSLPPCCFRKVLDERHHRRDLFLASLIVALSPCMPLGDYMAACTPAPRTPVPRRIIYRLIGADPRPSSPGARTPAACWRSRPSASCFLFFFQLVQGKLPLHLNVPGHPMTPALAWNTAVSFVTNTNWQAYSGESTQGSPRPDGRPDGAELRLRRRGMAVASPWSAGSPPARRPRQLLGRPGARHHPHPAADFHGAVILVAGGAIQNFHLHDQVVGTPPRAGGQQTITGPVASQEAIKELGTNGGGFFNANSGAPVREPDDLDQLSSRSSCCW